MFTLSLLLAVQTLLPQGVDSRPATTVARGVEYTVEMIDPTTSPDISCADAKYASRSSILTFRQNSTRNPTCAKVELDSISDISLDWTFKTEADMTQTPYGTWYGGTGWTGQPLYIEWDDAWMSEFREHSPQLTPSFTNREIIVGSLCGKVYFIDFQSGQISRQPLEVGNTIKGTVSLDPALNGNLYVGHGVPKQNPFGFSVFNLFTHQQTYSFGKDASAHRGWGAFDSSPIVVGQFLFWPAENGSLYKFSRQKGAIKPHSVLRYKIKGKAALGIENSMAVFRHYGYFGDNGGSVMCVDLNTMQPQWTYDNKDDIDASIVVDTTDVNAYLYVGSEIDKQGVDGFAYIAKLDALTGQPVWEHKEPCAKKHFGSTKTLDGGVFATPLIGVDDCRDLIFFSFAANQRSYGGMIVAFDKATGRVVRRMTLSNYLWSSAVGVSTADGRMHIVTADTQGYIYVIEGCTGKIVVRKKIGQNFESSPIVVGNSIVIGSRGREIYKLTIK